MGRHANRYRPQTIVHRHCRSASGADGVEKSNVLQIAGATVMALMGHPGIVANIARHQPAVILVFR